MIFRFGEAFLSHCTMEITISSLFWPRRVPIDWENGAYPLACGLPVSARRKQDHMVTALVLHPSVLEIPLWLVLGGFALACLGIVVIAQAARSDSRRGQ
jgi:hypothetical protein